MPDRTDMLTRATLQPHLVNLIARLGRADVELAVGLLLDYIDAGRAETSRPTEKQQAQPKPAGAPGQEWVLVPRVPTEEMVVHGFESRPSMSFSTEGEWAKFEAMTGCQQAAHCARLCWAAMLNAAPAPAGQPESGAVPHTFEDFARTTAPWLLDEPGSDADRLVQITARKAYEAGREGPRP